MITQEQLIADIKTIDDTQSLERVHQLIEQIKQQQKPKKPTLMSQLRSIEKINLPSDFTENLDAYLNGEKPF